MKLCYSFAAGLLVAATMGAGCGAKSGGHPLPEPPKVAACEPGVPGGRLVLSVLGNPRTFNPVLAVDNPSDAVARLLFSSLVTVNMETQEAEPGLAESWSVAPDQKTWTFKLRKNLRWSDGQPLTADDVVFTWNEVMYNPRYNRLTYDLFRGDGKNFAVTKIDDLTVRVVTPEIFAPFLEYFGSVAILPKHVLGAAVANGSFLDAYAVTNNPRTIVGSGPFRLKEFDSQRMVVLERNPEYWVVDKKGQRLPYFDEVQLDLTTSPIELESLFFNGKSAAFETIKPEQAWAFQQAAANGKFRLIDLGVGVQRDFFWFNQNTGSDKHGKPFVDPVKSKWFRDRRFREAISCAINRARIVKDVYNGQAQPVYAFLSADNKKWNNPGIANYSYNPQKARALFTELGMTNRAGDGRMVDAGGHPVEFTMVSSSENPIREAIAVRLADDLKQFGIVMHYDAEPFPKMLERINETMDYESACMGFDGGGLDPASQMNVLMSGAPLHQWFPSQRTPATDWERKIDVLMTDQMHTLEFDRRKRDFDEVQAIWANEMPMICIAAPTTEAGIRKDIGNVRPSIASAYHVTWNVEELYFKR